MRSIYEDTQTILIVTMIMYIKTTLLLYLHTWTMAAHANIRTFQTDRHHKLTFDIFTRM